MILNSAPVITDSAVTIDQYSVHIVHFPPLETYVDPDGQELTVEIISLLPFPELRMFQFRSCPQGDDESWDFSCLLDQDEIFSTPVNITDEFGRIVILHNSTVTSGTHSFQYRMFDGFSFSDFAEMVVTVTPLNLHPEAVSKLISGVEDEIMLIDLESADVEGDDILTYISTVPHHGKLFHVLDLGQIPTFPSPVSN